MKFFSSPALAVFGKNSSDQRFVYYFDGDPKTGEKEEPSSNEEAPKIKEKTSEELKSLEKSFGERLRDRVGRMNSPTAFNPPFKRPRETEDFRQDEDTSDTWFRLHSPFSALDWFDEKLHMDWFDKKSPVPSTSEATIPKPAVLPEEETAKEPKKDSQAPATKMPDYSDIPIVAPKALLFDFGSHSLREGSGKLGSPNDYTKSLQQFLVNLGHMNPSKLGKNEQYLGIFGPATSKAVKAFQTSVGLKPDGVVGKQTKEKLQAALGNNTVDRTPEIDSGQAAHKYIESHQTDRKFIALVQEKIKPQNANDGWVDGFWGPNSQAALKAKLKTDPQWLDETIAEHQRNRKAPEHLGVEALREKVSDIFYSDEKGKIPKLLELTDPSNMRQRNLVTRYLQEVYESTGNPGFAPLFSAIMEQYECPPGWTVERALGIAKSREFVAPELVDEAGNSVPQFVKRLSDPKLQAAMEASTTVLDLGKAYNPKTGELTINNQTISLAENVRALVAVGNTLEAASGLVDLPMEQMIDIEIKNWVYDSEAETIYALMHNGCKGNPVIIPIKERIASTPPSEPEEHCSLQESFEERGDITLANGNQIVFQKPAGKAGQDYVVFNPSLDFDGLSTKDQKAVYIVPGEVLKNQLKPGSHLATSGSRLVHEEVDCSPLVYRDIGVFDDVLPVRDNGSGVDRGNNGSGASKGGGNQEGGGGNQKGGGNKGGPDSQGR